MELQTFWQLMDDTKSTSKDGHEQADLLVNKLANYPLDEIISYQRLLYELLYRAYDWHLWEAAFVINCGCSDDAFMDFRAWLIGQGKVVYEQALETPDSLADLLLPGTRTQVEALLYVARRAYRRKTGHEIPEIPQEVPNLRHREDKPSLNNDAWEAGLKYKYPRLYAKFGDCADWYSDFSEDADIQEN
jgi:hypothetical protein